MNLFDLSGKVAIVTGGNGGIGLGIGLGLAQAGARVAIVGRNTAKSDFRCTTCTAMAVVFAIPRAYDPF